MRVYKINKLVGGKMRKIRKSQKQSQEELAYRIGVHRNHVGRIERGETNPPMHLIEKIARVLKIPLKDLFDF